MEEVLARLRRRAAAVPAALRRRYGGGGRPPELSTCSHREASYRRAVAAPAAGCELLVLETLLRRQGPHSAARRAGERRVYGLDGLCAAQRAGYACLAPARQADQADAGVTIQRRSAALGYVRRRRREPAATTLAAGTPVGRLAGLRAITLTLLILLIGAGLRSGCCGRGS